MNSERAASVQDVGGAPDEQQSDRIRAEEIRMASGDRVLAAVIADGSGVGGAEAAAQVVGQVFQIIQASKPSELEGAIRRGLEIADGRLRKSGNGAQSKVLVAATAVVVWKRRLYIAHVGDTLAIHVSRGTGNQLTQANSARLGSENQPQITTGRLQIRRGDRIVLASDGLMRRNPETDLPYVGQDEIAQHAAELPPNKAARHLISLALGRDVDDNVSVAVLAPRGGAKAKRSFPWVAAAAGALMLVLAAAAALVPSRPSTQPATDYGFAVLVDGGVLADQGSGTPELVPSLGTIRSASFLTASTDAKLGLQSTFAGGSAVSNANLYLAQSTGLELTSIDPRTPAGGPTASSPALGSDLTLVSGRLLILRESGTWEFRVHGQGFTASLIGAGRGAIGVQSASADFTLVCLSGPCRMGVDGAETVLLQSSQTVTGQNGRLGEPAEVDLGSWDLLCNACIDSSQ